MTLGHFSCETAENTTAVIFGDDVLGKEDERFLKCGGKERKVMVH